MKAAVKRTGNIASTLMVHARQLGARWRRSKLLRPRLASIGHLLSGNVLDALIMLAGVAIAARALGPAEYGVMVLVLTFGRLFERLVRFESWQPLIKFAAMEEQTSKPERLAQLYLYGLILDVTAASLAALLAVGTAFLLTPLLNLEAPHLELVAIYSVAIALNIRGMPTAALRMRGAFRTLAYVHIVPNLLRVGLAFICFLKGAGIHAFIIAWTVSQTLGTMLLLWLGFRALRMSGIPNPLRAPMRSFRGNFPGFLTFAWSSNLSSTLRTLTQEADTLLVGALAGTPAAGMYHIAKRIAKVAQQVGAHVQAVIYPDMARLWAIGNVKAFRRVTGRIQAALAAVAFSMLLVAWLIGDRIVRLGLGKAYEGAYPLLLTQLLAVSLILHAAPSRSALLAMNRPRYVLLVALLATIIFFSTAAFAIPAYGAMGGNLAHIGFAAVTALLLDIAWLRDGRREAAVQPASCLRHPSQSA